MKIRFDELITIQDWTDALQKILDAAALSIENEEGEDRLELQDLLRTYIKKSPAKVEFLDVIARKAIEDVAVAEISSSLARIQGRTAELKQAAGLIDAVAAEANKDARTLQFEATLDALSKAKTAIDTLRKLEKTLDSPDPNLLQKLMATGDTLMDLSKLLKPEKKQNSAGGQV